MNRFLDPFQLIHELLVDLKPAGGVDEDIVVAVILCVGNRRRGDLHRVPGAHFEYRYAGLFPDDLQLLDRSRAVDVARREERAVPPVFQQIRKLPGVCRLAGTLQAAQQHDGRG